MAASVSPTGRRTLLGLLLVASMMLVNAACSSDQPTTVTGEATSDPPAVTSDPADGLSVRLIGEADGAVICPGSTQPCVTLDRDVGVGVYRVLVTFEDGVASVVRAEPVESSSTRFADRCNGDVLPESAFNEIAALPQAEQEAAEADGTYAYDTLGQYILTIPDTYAERWLSPTRRVHLGVVGDAAPHVEALAELGLAEVVCVAGGFAHSDAELEQAQNEVGDMLESWAPLNEGAGWSRDAFAGTVTVNMYEVDESMIAQSRDRFGDLVELDGAFTVLNGSLDDLHEQLELASSDGPGPELTASCDSVVFPSLPPDVDGFPPLDAETQAIFDEFMTGPLSVETGFIEGFEMSVAEKTDMTLVLFGRSPDGSDFVNVRFENIGGVWSARGWGGCHIQVSAIGYGSAETVLDPDVEPDPASTTLQIWIRERECASGQAPDDRDVLPVVVETESRIEITTLVAPVAGGANCPSNPWFPVTVELDQPIGNRTIVDMQAPPGVERTWPPESLDS